MELVKVTLVPGVTLLVGVALNAVINRSILVTVAAGVLTVTPVDHPADHLPDASPALIW